jgi:titin
MVNGCAAGQSGADVIQFNLGSATLTISPASPMPNITEPVTIDGYSQSGASANTLASASNAVIKVTLDGSGSTSGTPQTNYGFTIVGSGGGTTIKGLAIGNFGTGGIHISGSSNNHIVGNFIGTNAAGTLAETNGGQDYRAGVYITATSNTEVSSGNSVGGTAPADRNLISANASGVTLDAYSGGVADANQIVGNLMGTNKTGTAVLSGNVGGGGVVVLEDVSNTVIGSPVGTTPGGACSGGCNLITGNYYQVNLSELTSLTSTTIVQSNMIGLNVAGTGEPNNYPSNPQSGVEISSSSGNFLIGGTTAAARNVIANGFAQVEVENYQQTGTVTIEGNYIGTTSNGTAAGGSGTFVNDYGIHIYNTTGVIIGGTAAGAGNLVSGVGYSGIFLEGAQNTTIQGNLIGTQADGTSEIGNGSHGIEVRYGNISPDGNVIGATTSGGPGGNTIAYSGETNAGQSGGVVVFSGTANRISTNSIFSNAGATGTDLGIDLGGDTPNQPACSAGLGANNLQNYPDNIGFYTTGGVTHVTGTLAAEASTTYTIEFYANATANPTSYGEGKTYVGSTTVTTSASPTCTVSFNATTTVPVSAMSVVSAIAIDPNGNTSEFSQTLDRIFADGFDGD